MEEHKPEEAQQWQPIPDELQQRAHLVWRSLKILFSGALLLFFVFVGLAGFLLCHAFGFTGLVIGAAVLVIGIVMLYRHLLTY